MKNLLISLFVLIAAPSFQPAYADGRGLELAELNKTMGPLRSSINSCYLASAGKLGGHLELTLEITSYGSLHAVDVSTPDLRNKSVVRKVSNCVKGIVKQLTFPARKVSTTAKFAYIFHKARAPGDGPQESCWNPRGCPGQ